MMDIKEILEKLKLNQITVEEAQKLLEQPMDYATIDYDRKRRTGVPEVIYGKGKTVQQIKGIVENMLSHHQTDILITRVDEEKYQELKQFFPRFI